MEKAKNIDLVKMMRSDEDAKGGPVEADVHPAEVENYKKAGWKEASNIENNETSTLLYPLDEALDLIAAAQTIEEIEEITMNDDRKKVMKAKEKRIQELEEG